MEKDFELINFLCMQEFGLLPNPEFLKNEDKVTELTIVLLQRQPLYALHNVLEKMNHTLKQLDEMECRLQRIEFSKYLSPPNV